MPTKLQKSLERETRQMELRGVRVHNLKHLDLNLPLGKLVVLSGVSGSGKSSLAFDTLYAEGQRRYIESFSVSARQQLERIDRPDADRIAHVPLAIAIRSHHSHRYRQDSRATVATVAGVLDGLRFLFSRIGHIVCPACRIEVRSHTPADVAQSIATLPPETRCQLVMTLPDRAASTPSDWLARGFSRGIWHGQTQDLNQKPDWPTNQEPWIVMDRFIAGKTTADRRLESAAAAFREGNGRCQILIETQPSSEANTCEIDGRHWMIRTFHRGLVCSNCSRAFLPPEPRLFSHFSSGACPACNGTGRSSNLTIDEATCAACRGTRFRDEATAVLIDDVSIAEICRKRAADVDQFLKKLHESLNPQELDSSSLIRMEIERHLKGIRDLGLDYLNLDRSAETLSGGETRRLMLAALLGTRITGTLVVVDEPSAGLTQDEIPKVVAALRQLIELGNSVVVVDHSPHVISAADHLVELGPGAGPDGGQIVFQGPPPPMESAADRPTELKRNRIASPGTNAEPLRLRGIHFRNLHNFEAEFPLGGLTVVTGPGGSGKTSLVTQVLFPVVCQRLGMAVAKTAGERGQLTGGEPLVEAVLIDQLPLTRSPRSNPATWLEVFDEIRRTFAATVDARQRGLTAQSFSFNSPQGGRCRSCQGTGQLKQNMQFLPDVQLICPECHGTRYRREILDVKYRGRSIADVLAMSVSEAAIFFRSQPRVQRRFQLLKQIGLDYLVLGQPSETLSGGEAQRLKLAARLALPGRGPGLIVCDEPTTGLNPRDVGSLIGCFQELLANGHTIVLADNDPNLIATADHVIELERDNSSQPTS